MKVTVVVFILNLHCSCVCSGGLNREARQPLVATVRFTHTIERIILGYLIALTKCLGLGGVLEKACLAVLESA